MKKICVFLSMAVFLALAGICHGQSDENDLLDRGTLTKSFCGVNDDVADSGLEFGLCMTYVYQANVKGGLSTHTRRGRHSGSYDLEMWADLEKLLGFESGNIYMLVEGGWPRAEGVNELSVGSAFGTNADAIGNEAILVKELYYEIPGLGDNVTLAVGKIDFTGVFDASAYADNECTQFLNAAFVDDPTIPFPEYSLGAVLILNPTDSWYIMAGVADAQADGRETGFRTAFHNEDYFFYALETGITPQLNCDEGAMPGAYRVGMWIDGQDKARFSNQKNSHDDIGLYLSCDQLLTRENSVPEDTQGLGVFGRVGYANSDLNELENFWSIGLQYQGLIAGRDDDVLSGAFAQGIFSDYAGANEGNGYTQNDESVLEVYYSAHVTPWFNISPNIQYIAAPGGDQTNKDAVVFGLRTQMVF